MLTATPLTPLAPFQTAGYLLATPYRNEGYEDVIVSAESTLDAAGARVSYAFKVTPGAVYHVPVGLTPVQQKDFDRGWTMKPGDVYNPGYIESFLERNSALRSFEGYSASYKATRDPDTHQTDVVVRFFAAAGKP